MIRPVDHWKNQLYEKDQEIERLIAENSVLLTAIATIAGQKLCREMERPDDGDYEYAYEEMIMVARIASDSVSTCQKRPVSEDVCGECGAGPDDE